MLVRGIPPRALIISDLHLGDGSRADDFGDNDAAFLKWIVGVNPDVVYLNGDIYELWQFGMERIRAAHPSVCDELSKDRYVWISGNHDYELLGMSSVVLEVKPNFRILVSHGHQSDPGMNCPMLRGLVWSLGMIERLPFMDWVDNPDQFTKHPNSADIKTEEYATKQLSNGYDVVICGHTHKKGIKYIEPRLGHYINCGTCMHGSFEGVLLDSKARKIELI